MPKQFFAKAASQISNLALQSRVCGSGTNPQLKNQHISVIFQPSHTITNKHDCAALRILTLPPERSLMSYYIE